MSKAQADDAAEATPAPRRSTRHSAAAPEEVSGQVDGPQTRGGGQGRGARAAAAKASSAGPDVAEAAATPKPRGRGAASAGKPVAGGAQSAALPTVAKARATQPKGRKVLQPADDLASGSEEDEGAASEEQESPARAKRKRKSSEATKRRKARDLAKARAKAAEQAALGGVGESDAEPDPLAAGQDGDGAAGSDQDLLAFPIPQAPLPPRATVQPTPSPKKAGERELGEGEDSDLEDVAFVRPWEVIAKRARRGPPATTPARRTAAAELAPSKQHKGALAGGVPLAGGKDNEVAEEVFDSVEAGNGAEKPARNGDSGENDENDENERPTARRQTKALQQELAGAARASALEDLGARMFQMLGQLKGAGINIDFPVAPAGGEAAGATLPLQPAAAALSPQKPAAHSRADNFKGDGSSREGKPMTEGRKYGAVFGSYDTFEVGLNVSDYSRKNNDAVRDNTELFYPLVRKGYAMNRFRESYVAVIAMPVSGDLKGQTYAWGSPRLLQDLPGFLDDCALELSHGTLDKRAHGYAKALSDYKRKALKDLAELNRKHTEAELQGVSAPHGALPASSHTRDGAEKLNAAAGKPSDGKRASQASDAAPHKRKRGIEDEGDEGRPAQRAKVATADGVELAPPPPKVLPRRPFTPRNASTRRAVEGLPE